MKPRYQGLNIAVAAALLTGSLGALAATHRVEAQNPASSPVHDNEHDACEHAIELATNNAFALAHTRNISITERKCTTCQTLDTTGTAQQGMTVYVCTASVEWDDRR